VDKTRRTRDEKRTWKKPLPPNPFLLHLNILARTQYFDEFLESSNTFKNSSQKFVDPLLGKPSNHALTDNDQAQLQYSLTKLTEFKSSKLVCTDKESDMIDFVLSDLIRNLISDKSFHALVQNIKDEEIPYFFQYSPSLQQEAFTESSNPVSRKQSEVSQINKANMVDRNSFSNGNTNHNNGKAVKQLKKKNSLNQALDTNINIGSVENLQSLKT
jgi:hypothetical protein